MLDNQQIEKLDGEEIKSQQLPDEKNSIHHKGNLLTEVDKSIPVGFEEFDLDDIEVIESKVFA